MHHKEKHIQKEMNQQHQLKVAKINKKEKVVKIVKMVKVSKINMKEKMVINIIRHLIQIKPPKQLQAIILMFHHHLKKD